MPEQADFLAGIAQAASRAGTLRCAVVWHEVAEVWLAQQSRALAAYRQWWTHRELPPLREA